MYIALIGKARLYNYESYDRINRREFDTRTLYFARHSRRDLYSTRRRINKSTRKRNDPRSLFASVIIRDGRRRTSILEREMRRQLYTPTLYCFEHLLLYTIHMLIKKKWLNYDRGSSIVRGSTLTQYTPIFEYSIFS